MVGAPRSGTSILFHVLSTHPEIWSLYRESHAVIDRRYPPLASGRDSHVLTEEDVDEAGATALDHDFFRRLGNLEGGVGRKSRMIPLIARAKLAPWISRVGRSRKRPPIRMVEKTPENSFRIRFLRRVFPDGKFVFVARDPRGSIASIYRGWRQPRKFKTHRLPPGYEIEGYRGSHWSFGLPPDWRSWSGRTLMEICALQWRAYVDRCLRDLQGLGSDTLRVDYEDLLAKPGASVDRLAAWAGLDPRPLSRFADHLPVVNTRSRPDPEKWQRMRDEVEAVVPIVEEAALRLGYDIRTGAR